MDLGGGGAEDPRALSGRRDRGAGDGLPRVTSRAGCSRAVGVIGAGEGKGKGRGGRRGMEVTGGACRSLPLSAYVRSAIAPAPHGVTRRDCAPRPRRATGTAGTSPAVGNRPERMRHGGQPLAVQCGLGGGGARKRELYRLSLAESLPALTEAAIGFDGAWSRHDAGTSCAKEAQ